MKNTLENETRREVYAPSFGIHLFLGIAALIGCWGMTFMISGLTTAGNLQDAGRVLITAVTGI